MIRFYKTKQLMVVLGILATVLAFGSSCAKAVAPTADFSVDTSQAAVGEPIQFTDQSTGNPTTWSWDFGDGNTSTEQNPTYSYTTRGTYTVSLKVTNEAGSDIMIKSAYVQVMEVIPPAAAFTITDDLGEVFHFDAPVKSIISLAPSITEIVFAVEAQDILIGRTDFCNFPPEASSIESVGGFSTVDKERIVILSPQVVLATSLHSASGDTAWLKEKGIQVITIDPKTLDDVLDAIILVGKLTGHDAQASEVTTSMQRSIDYIHDRTVSLPATQKPRVLHVTWHDPLWVAGAHTFTDALIEIAGGVNIFGDVSDYTQVDMETAVTRNPEIIIIDYGHGSAMGASYAAISGKDSPFTHTDAYKNDRIYRIDADLVSRSGPRIVEALDLYAKFIHPEIFD